MVTLLLIIIYIAFISLGLPDSLFGITWPVAHLDLGISEGFGSLITATITCGSVCMSFFAGKVIRKFGTGWVSAISVCLTVVGLFGISLSSSIRALIFCSAALGIGAGAVDTALNDYAAKYYKSHHLNWLNAFWGIGVMVSPIIMSRFLISGNWRGGYHIVGIVIGSITLILFAAIPLWKKTEQKVLKIADSEETEDTRVKRNPLKIKGVPCAMAILAFYCAIEFTVGAWGATFLVNIKNLSASSASLWISLYYGGIALGRIISGILSIKLSDKILMRYGMVIVICGTILLAIPFSSAFTLAGLLFIGLGCAPIYPCSVHATIDRFGSTYSADIIGFQLSASFAGPLVFQSLFGVAASATTFSIMPFVLLGFAVIQLTLSERLNIILIK